MEGHLKSCNPNQTSEAWKRWANFWIHLILKFALIWAKKGFKTIQIEIADNKKLSVKLFSSEWCFLFQNRVILRPDIELLNIFHYIQALRVLQLQFISNVKSKTQQSINNSYRIIYMNINYFDVFTYRQLYWVNTIW